MHDPTRRMQRIEMCFSLTICVIDKMPDETLPTTRGNRGMPLRAPSSLFVAGTIVERVLNWFIAKTEWQLSICHSILTVASPD